MSPDHSQGKVSRGTRVRNEPYHTGDPGYLGRVFTTCIEYVKASGKCEALKFCNTSANFVCIQQIILSMAVSSSREIMPLHCDKKEA